MTEINTVFHENRLVLEISGKTYPHRQFLRDQEGEWDDERKIWILNSTKYETVTEYFKKHHETKTLIKEDQKKEREKIKLKKFLCRGNGCYCQSRGYKPCKLCSQACCNQANYNESIDPYWAYCQIHKTRYWMCND